MAFFGILAGAVISVTVYLLWLYFFYQPRVADSEVIVQPEDRLRPGQIGAICIPICLFIFAWTSRERYSFKIFILPCKEIILTIAQCTLDCANHWNRLLRPGILPFLPISSELPW